MENPFEVIARRLSTIEELLIDIKHRPASSLTAPLPMPSSRIDFSTLMREYYSGIPESTVRQDTARLSRTKVGKRILFDRSEVEEHLQRKRQYSSGELTNQVDVEFTNQHRSRKGGRAVV